MLELSIVRMLHYPFGMLQPNRAFSSGNSYRYGFNGKEKDKEVKGEGNQQDYGFRIYDPRLGRFLSEDPITAEYPELTPYQFASNTPIQAIDLDGLEAAGVGCGCPMRQLESSDAMEQTGTAMVAVGRGYSKAAFNTLKGTAHAITHPKQTINTVVHAVSNPKETWNSMKIGFREWGKQLLSKDPNVAGEATGGGLFFATTVVAPAPPIAKFLGLKFTGKLPKYMSGKFTIGSKTLSKVTEHLKQFGKHAENDIMLSDLKKIVNGEMKATEIHINFAKHELREAEMMKQGLRPDKAHEAVLKEQGMYHKDYEKKLYTEEALKAGNAQMAKEAANK